MAQWFAFLFSKKVVVVGLALVSGLGITYLPRYFGYKLPDDNKIEEGIEKIIDEETGFDIDLTPDSPEKDTKDSDHGTS